MADAVKTIRINIEAAGAESGARRVNKALESIGKSGSSLTGVNDNNASSFNRLAGAMAGTEKAGGAVGKVLEDIRGRSAAAIPMVGNLVSSLLSMGPVAGIIGATAIAIAAIGTASVNAAAKTQQWQANLLTVTKSSSAAQAAYAGLVNFANKTPFTLEQSVNGFIKLRALGLATSENIMTAYGNTAAAMGKSMSQMIEAVADATTGEFERLKEFGIKAKQSGDTVAFTFQGVTTKVKKNATEIQNYLVGIGTSNFGGAMARQMDTLSGAFSNLGDKIFLMFSRMGEGELGKSVASFANLLADGVEAVTPLLGGLMDIVGGIARVFVEATKVAVDLFTIGFGGAGNAGSLLNNLGAAASFIGQAISVSAKIVGQQLSFIAQVAGMAVGLIQDAFKGLFSFIDLGWSDSKQSVSESLVGWLRSSQYVANQLPNLFKVALLEVRLAFMQTGEAIKKTLQGDLSGWGKIDLSFNRTGKLNDTINKGAAAIAGDQKANRRWIDNAAGKTDKGNIDLPALGKDKNAPTKNKEAEDRIKKEKEFWATLKGEAETAQMLPLAAAQHTKELELHKILGRDLTTAEKTRVDNAVLLIEKNKFLGDAAKAHADAVMKAGVEEEALKSRIAGKTTDQIEQERQLLEFRNNAIQKGVDLKDAEYLAAEKVYQTDLARLAAVTKINQQLDTAAKLAGQYSQSYQRQQAGKDYATNMAAAQTALDKGTITQQQYQEIVAGLKQSMDDVANNAREKFGQRITELGDLIGGNWGAAIGKVGNAISGLAAAAKGDSFKGLGAGGAVMDLLGRKLDGSLNGLGESVKEGVKGFGDNLFKSDTWKRPLESLSSGFGDFKNNMGEIFGKNGDLMKGLGNTLGNALGGASLGSAIGGALGLDSTGSTVGGALGSAFGPLGSIAGSVLGGLLGGLFKSTPSGSVVINSATGTNQLSSNNASVSQNLSAMGSGVQQSLQSLASQLGAELGSFAVSIGQYKNYYRVSASGSSSVGNKRYPDGAGSDILYDGTDATQALKIALQNAIEDGALVGIRASTKALLTASTDIETQLTKALSFENAFKQLKSVLDPVGSAVDTVNTEMKNLISIFKEAGATSEEWAQLEQLQQIKLQQIIDEQTSSLQEVMKTLNGEASGKSALSLLTDEMSQLDTFKQQLATGAQIDQSKYSTLVQDILNNAQSVYGNNSTEYQSIIAGLKDTTTTAIGNVQSAYEAAIAAGGTAADPASTVAEINAQTEALTASLGVSNDYLAQIVSQLKNLGYSTAQVNAMISNGSINYAVINGELQYG